MARGFIYMATVIDWFSRKVLAWRLSVTMDVGFCIEAVEEAMARDTASRRSSTPIRARSSPAEPSPRC